MSTVDQTTSSSTGRLVVVSSSAGGIEELAVLVGILPANFPAPIVLAQHLDPSRPGSLNTLLQQHTSLPVNVITSHTPLQPGKIYAVPANRHVTLSRAYCDHPAGSRAGYHPTINRGTTVRICSYLLMLPMEPSLV